MPTTTHTHRGCCKKRECGIRKTQPVPVKVQFFFTLLQQDQGKIRREKQKINETFEKIAKIHANLKLPPSLLLLSLTRHSRPDTAAPCRPTMSCHRFSLSRLEIDERVERDEEMIRGLKSPNLSF